MKKALAILLVLTMVFIFTACGNKKATFSEPEVSSVTTTTEPSTDASEPSAETSKPSDEAIEPIETAIVGTWISVCRIEDEYCKGILWYECFTINEDGTFTHDSVQYYHSNYVPMEGEVGWYVKPVGWPTLRGTYTLDGMHLVLSGCNDYYLEEEKTYQLIRVDENKLVVDNQFGTYYSPEIVGDMELLELCEYLGVDASAES